MSYQKFLGKKEVRVLPHFGGFEIEAPDRLLRLDAQLAAGWYRFEVKGRKAAVLEAADPDPELLERMPSVRGHLLGDRIFRSGAVAELLFFLPPDQPPRLSLIRARRWPKGQLVFDSLEFDTEAGAVFVLAKDRADIVELASIIGRLATTRQAQP